MDTSKLKIASVKLVNGGMKGIEVEYLLPSIKGNVQFFDIYKVKRKAPVHTELEECFSWLRGHLLDVCGYTMEKEEREYLLGSLEMTGVKYGDKGIVLKGELTVMNGMGVLDIETPLITPAVYAEYGKIAAIIDGIYTEAKEYMAGKKVMSDAQIVARFNAKNKEFDHDAFKAMTKEKQRDWATKILEDQGCMVFHNEEITEDDGKETVVIDMKPVAVPTTEVDAFAPDEDRTPALSMEEINSMNPAPKKAEPKESTAITLTESGNDFSLAALVKTPEKKSTAKKKVA